MSAWLTSAECVVIDRINTTFGKHGYTNLVIGYAQYNSNIHQAVPNSSGGSGQLLCRYMQLLMLNSSVSTHGPGIILPLFFVPFVPMSIFRQSSRLSRSLPRFLRIPCFFSSCLFDHLSSYILTTCPVYIILLFIIVPTKRESAQCCCSLRHSILLYWLPIRQRIQFKLLLLVYRCTHQLAPAISDGSRCAIRSRQIAAFRMC